MIEQSRADAFARRVRIHVFQQSATTGRVPQVPEIARALNRSEQEVRAALRALAAAKVLILASNDGDIWAANPFCAVPSSIRVATRAMSYWGICIWDALGIAAAVDADADAVITAPCGDCAVTMSLEVRDRILARSEGVVHFAIPAHHWWGNIGFT